MSCQDKDFSSGDQVPILSINQLGATFWGKSRNLDSLDIPFFYSEQKNYIAEIRNCFEQRRTFWKLHVLHMFLPAAAVAAIQASLSCTKVVTLPFLTVEAPVFSSTWWEIVFNWTSNQPPLSCLEDAWLPWEAAELVLLSVDAVMADLVLRTSSAHRLHASYPSAKQTNREWPLFSQSTK